MNEMQKAAEDAFWLGTGFLINGKHYPAENIKVHIDYTEKDNEAVKTEQHFSIHCCANRKYKHSFRKLWQDMHNLSNNRKSKGWRKHVRQAKASK